MWIKMSMACLLYGLTIAIVYDKGFDRIRNPTKTGGPVQRTVQVEMPPVQMTGRFAAGGGKKSKT